MGLCPEQVFHDRLRTRKLNNRIQAREGIEVLVTGGGEQAEFLGISIPRGLIILTGHPHDFQVELVKMPVLDVFEQFVTRLSTAHHTHIQG